MPNYKHHAPPERRESNLFCIILEKVMKQSAILKIAIIAFCILIVPSDLRAQETTRRLWDSEFFKPRNKPSAAPSKPRRRYRITTPAITPDSVAGDTVIGVTLWRLRPATARDDKQATVRLLKHPKDNTKTLEWTPERISVDTPLALGQRVRMSIEAARTGYLYVIDRELYADGTMGEPYLIFPTKRLRGGNNRVTVGQVVDIPALEDAPNYFYLEPQERADLAGEIISVLVTPQPLPEVKLGDEETTLPKAEVEKWEQMWGTRVGKMELASATTRAWTPAEKAASSGKPLAPDAPAPQTVFYRPEAKSDQPVMISVKLRYGAAPAPPRKNARN